MRQNSLRLHFLVTSNNTVGINHFQPSAALHVLESGTNALIIATSAFATPALLVTSDNKVGINHFQPSAALHVLESGTNALLIATSSFATPALIVTSDNKVGINNCSTERSTSL